MTTSVIIIPAYNAAATIGETLQALQANPRLADVERVIVLDDCSTDRTAAIARRSWTSPVPFDIWSNERNRGERRTVNAAMARLGETVDWTFILHADDVVKPHWLELYLSAFEGAPSSVASVCSSYNAWWPETGRIEDGEDKPDAVPVLVPGTQEHVLGTVERGCWWHISGCAIRNEAFRDIGPFEPDMPQLGDWEWLLRCLTKGWGIWYLPRTTMLYRQHHASVSSASFRLGRDLRERIRILQALHDTGALDRAVYRRHLARTALVTCRRILVRGARRDWAGLKSHVAILGGLLQSTLTVRKVG